MITLRLLDSVSSVGKKVNKASAQEINRIMKKNKPKVVGSLRTAIKNWALVQPEIESLRALVTPGELSSIFGIPVRENRKITDVIVYSISNAIYVNIGTITEKLKGTIEFNFQPTTFSNLLALPEGFTITSNNQQLHWMDWLLTKGSQTIIYGYSYIPGVGLGRSGSGKMQAGGVFRVPPQYSGTISDNFVTRLFENREKEISDILKGLFNGV